MLNKYGLSRKFQPDWYAFDVSAYSRLLMMRPYRSATARYVQLNDNTRNDVNRLDAFFDVARSVLDADKRRQATQANVTVAKKHQAVRPGALPRTRSSLPECSRR